MSWAGQVARGVTEQMGEQREMGEGGEGWRRNQRCEPGRLAQRVRGSQSPWLVAHSSMSVAGIGEVGGGIE